MHAAYWKYVVTRRLTGEKRGSFALKGSNWFARPTADEDSWRADLRLLEDCHRRLRAAVASLDARTLARTAHESSSVLSLVSGIVAHDVYHAGQIQLIKRLMQARASGE